MHAPIRSVVRSLALLGCAAVAFSVSAWTGVPLSAQTKPAKAAAKAAVSVVDINRATSAELEAVPGIGKAYAAKIIGGRPYTSKLQLVQKKVLSQAIYDKVKEHLIAKQ